MYKSVSSDRLTTKGKFKTHTHTSTHRLQYMLTQRKPAAHAQTGSKRHQRLQRREVRPFFLGRFSPHLTSDKPPLTQRANRLPGCWQTHKTHTDTQHTDLEMNRESVPFPVPALLESRLQLPGQMPSNTTAGCSTRLNAALSRSHRLDPK